MSEKNTVLKVLFIALPDQVWSPQALSIVKTHFEHVKAIPYSVGSSAAYRKNVRATIDDENFDYLISFENPLFLRPQDFEKARKGAINLHPSPPEHPGLGGYIFPRVFPDKRSFHGSTLHEVSRKLDSGTIYDVNRFEVGDLSNEELVVTTNAGMLAQLERAVLMMKSGVETSALLREECANEVWSSVYYSGKDELKWVSSLPIGHPDRDLSMEDGKIFTEGKFACAATSFDSV
eukprot:TRINITY_DN7060_c0_g1_i1.p1 TRINITY_DN7060_c0_g1~~TRINITY_DN7060_c0_g1_i1.p1  ORF type:complete len:259 (+),score=46.56 TRINITY_DN7060_c0_g1_i1:78-779(+)